MSRRLLAFIALAIMSIFVIAACDSGGSAADPGAYTVSAEEAVQMIESDERTVIDVRSPAEYADAHIEGAVNIDVDGDFEAQIEELDPEEPYLVYCRSGNRSAQAAELMEEAGFQDVADAGGLADLARAGAPVE